MTGIIVILLLTLLQLACGFGVLTLCRIHLRPALFFSIALLLGVAVFGMVPFILQLLYLPLTGLNIFLSLLLVCILLNIKRKKGVAEVKQMWRGARFNIKLYEIPVLLVILFIVFVSVWRCYYYPPTPRDLTSGAEAVAEYAVREKTMINSLFTVNLETTNNPYKSPFVTCLQIIYKFAGFPFGQIWLSSIFIGFIIFLYHVLCLSVHRLIGGLLLIFFLAIPEMYAYTFMVLFDYSNTVFFFLACYFLFLYFNNRRFNYFLFAALLMGIATYIRSETLVLAGLLAPIMAWYHIKRKDGARWLLQPLLFMLPSLLFYFISIPLYINHYLPVVYNVSGEVNNHLMNLRPLYKRFIEMNAQLIFGEMGTDNYAWFIYIFLLFFLAELIVKRTFTSAAKNWLYAILIIYLGLPLLGYLLPLHNLDYSTKRGLFRIFPLMLLYIANNSLMIELSIKIKNWEAVNSQ